MKQKLLTFIISLAITIKAGAQERTVENRPYTDLRPFHFGVLVGTHFQDIEFQNAGPVTYLDADGIEQQSCVTVSFSAQSIQSQQALKMMTIQVLAMRLVLMSVCLILTSSSAHSVRTTTSV